MTFVSRLPEWQSNAREAIDAGLVAAAALLANEVKDRLQDGYTSGDYVTGQAMQSVQISEPYDDGVDVRKIEVGSDLVYVLAWEVGFHHAGNGAFYRSEKWRPAAFDRASDAAEVFNETVRSAMGST